MTSSNAHVPLLRRFTSAVVSALSVSLIALAAVSLLFFGGNPATLGQLFDFFVGSTLVVFVLLAAFALIGIYRFWYLRLIGGIVAGVAGALVGSAVTLVSGGSTLAGGAVGQLVSTLGGPNLPFVLATIIGTVTAGNAVWRRLVGGEADASTRRIAIVRAPADTLADGELTHLERVPVDLELANAQWDEYVALLSNAGWDIVEVPVATGQPDSVFVEDTMVVFGDTAVIGSPGADSRAGEIVEAERIVTELGLTIRRIEMPGTLDGGDVLKVGRTVYVGRGGRTNAEGIRQLRALVTPLGYTVVAVPVTKALHLKSAVTALPDGTVIGYAPLVDDPSVFGRYLAVPEAEGVAVVVLADDTVLMSSAAPESSALIADLGYRVLTADISEFEKLEGCVTCLSVRVR
ncbi:dimethylargininase [Glaciihabitans sp. GrIS 2.15]|uniref:dimethylargininase n=1 Tax=Glaciihabitans sp. GrIS 2.15 TaxID=3071710 RepID=UPI002DFAC6F7|nr:dimethylargininase [Glaciihabitans sp. GrIS 2.15]MEC5169022.1 dimethylargininase [Glaciihabitans sp. GrIS 2.15]